MWNKSKNIKKIIASSAIVILLGITIVCFLLKTQPGMIYYLSIAFAPFTKTTVTIDEEAQLFIQTRPNTCGAAALAYLVNNCGVKTKEKEIIGLVKLREEGITMNDLVQAARKLGFSSWGEKQNFEALKNATKPIITLINDTHYVVVKDINNGFITLFDPALGYVEINESLFNSIWNQYSMIILCKY